jgi:hypothetical protein
MNAALPILLERNSKQKTEAFIDGIWYTIARNRMTYNEQGKRTSLDDDGNQTLVKTCPAK